MSGTTVKTAAEAAGVKCPMDSGDQKHENGCNGCVHQQKCYNAVMSAMGF